jgi:hypothetical protein
MTSYITEYGTSSERSRMNSALERQGFPQESRKVSVCESPRTPVTPVNGAILRSLIPSGGRYKKSSLEKDLEILLACYKNFQRTVSYQYLKKKIKGFEDLTVEGYRL